MKMILIAILGFIASGINAQPAKTTAKELYSGQINEQPIRVYLETIETFEKEFNSYITTAYKGWYKMSSGKKIKISGSWEGSGPIKLQEKRNGKKITTFSLEDYTEPGKIKTLKGTYYFANKEQAILLTIIKI